jgi:hypothetical protein
VKLATNQPASQGTVLYCTVSDRQYVTLGEKSYGRERWMRTMDANDGRERWMRTMEANDGRERWIRTMDAAYIAYARHVGLPFLSYPTTLSRS